MKVAILSLNQTHMESIKKVLLESSSTLQISLFKKGASDLLAIANQEHPDLIILDGVCSEISELDQLEHFVRQYPQVAIISLREGESSEFLISALRVGVRDVLPLPLQSEALIDAVARVEQRHLSAKPLFKPQAKVIAFIASKGGSGATFIAANLAYILAATQNVRVAFLDFNLQLGDAYLFVTDKVPATSIADVTINIDRLDASFLDSSMVQILPNFSLLAAPESPELAVAIRPEHIDAILKLVKDNYDFVILDIGRILSSVSVKALDKADLIFPVLQETLPFIRDGKHLIQTLKNLGYAKEKIKPILNRYEKNGDIGLDDIETALDIKVFQAIPNSYKTVSASVNQGVPIFKLSHHDEVTKVLVDMARRLVTRPIEAVVQPVGWLSQFFKSK